MIERFALRPMMGRPFIAIVMVTFGIGSIIRGMVGMIWGPNDLQIPAILSRSPVMLGDIFIPGKTARAFAIAVVIVGALIAFLRYSRAGIALRAAAADQITAYSMGIDVRRVIAFTWVIAAVTGCISGILMANVNTLTPHLGLVALNVLSVVILGGMNSIGGVLVAGFIIGWLEAVTGWVLGHRVPRDHALHPRPAGPSRASDRPVRHQRNRENLMVEQPCKPRSSRTAARERIGRDWLWS